MGLELRAEWTPCSWDNEEEILGAHFMESLKVPKLGLVLLVDDVRRI
jgi:hypothetical protein